MDNLYVRMILYVVSPLLATGVALLPGWGVAYADGVLTVDLKTLAGSAVAGLGMSIGILEKFGVK